ncbi:DUF4279 domain-containing protein [Streptomyces cucumeris]|uniref:DUF4279 domain-containing protein n=1 Tax=Streptomyces cucumeris TaxID=2962890 RepID=UPI003D711365
MALLNQDFRMEAYTQSKGPWVLTDVSLIMEGPELEPEFVTSLLKIQPTGKRRPGPDRWRPDGDENGLWILRCNEHLSRDLLEQMKWVLSRIEPRAAELRNLMTSGYETRLRVYGFVGSGSTFQLPVDLISRIALLGVPLEVVTNTNER